MRIPNNGKAHENLVADSRKEQGLEVAVFLFLIVPSMTLSFFVIRQGSLGFVFTASSAILRDLAMVSLILFFLWRNGEPLEVLGWNFKNGGGVAPCLFSGCNSGDSGRDHLPRLSAPALPSP
jgi:hypothetical protein